MPKKKTQEEFVDELKRTHPNLKVLGKYLGDKEYVDVYCTIHNYKFSTKPNWLHHGSNCQKCYDERRGLTLKKSVKALIDEMNEKHNGRYKYPYIDREYKNNKSIITIVCPKHGEFPQTINHHLRGQGCAKCNESHLESFVEEFLIRNNIDYISQYRDYNILGYKSLDFYLPKYNVAIECQGIQHFKSVEYFGGNKLLNETIERDISKYKSLKENRINLIYVTNKKNEHFLRDNRFNKIYDKNVFFKEDVKKLKAFLNGLLI
jgi:hypothetical protein